MEAADHDLDARLAEGPRDIDGAGKFIRLHADDADQAEAAVLLDRRAISRVLDAGVGLVHGGDVDREDRGQAICRSAAPFARL